MVAILHEIPHMNTTIVDSQGVERKKKILSFWPPLDINHVNDLHSYVFFSCCD